ncbi:SDR family NAD(P)-dependent oxidoreductase [Peribacillus frigoritolerans]|nr:SDR family NAD(P)-dependent oxidoreductase [Peribacillus frigoritolerans]MDF2000199.1 SDR family NAD(P)-dependent oxidoreductase [Peribacillus frigoritolerans]
MTNRTILVKGGTSGIGSAIAKKFLEMGNTVIVTSRSRPADSSIWITNIHSHNPRLVTLQNGLKFYTKNRGGLQNEKNCSYHWSVGWDWQRVGGSFRQRWT